MNGVLVFKIINETQGKKTNNKKKTKNNNGK